MARPQQWCAGALSGGGRALADDAASYERIIVLFNGNDPDALDEARSQWKLAKATGLPCQYWQQNDAGRWEKKA